MAIPRHPLKSRYFWIAVVLSGVAMEIGDRVISCPIMGLALVLAYLGGTEA